MVRESCEPGKTVSMVARQHGVNPNQLFHWRDSRIRLGHRFEASDHAGVQSTMAESFVKTMKRDYVAFMPKPDAETVVRNLAIAFEHYNEQPHGALNYRSPREFRRAMELST